MNGKQQGEHRTVTRRLEHTLTSVAEATVLRLSAIEKRMDKAEQKVRGDLSEQRSDLSARITALEFEIQREAAWRKENDNLQVLRLDALETLRHRGFWGRLNWLLTGR